MPSKNSSGVISFAKFLMPRLSESSFAYIVSLKPLLSKPTENVLSGKAVATT